MLHVKSRREKPVPVAQQALADTLSLDYLPISSQRRKGGTDIPKSIQRKRLNLGSFSLAPNFWHHSFFGQCRHQVWTRKKLFGFKTQPLCFFCISVDTSVSYFLIVSVQFFFFY